MVVAAPALGAAEAGLSTFALTPRQAVLGFRPHTYWTAVAVVCGDVDAPEVMARKRVVFASRAERSIYHQAMEHPAAEALIERVRRVVTDNAEREIATVLAAAARAGLLVRVAVVPIGRIRPPARLEDILKVHARIHAAEGEFYRDTVAAACAARGLRVLRTVERDLPDLVEALVPPPSLATRLRRLGEDLGPPWGEDYRLATLAAWTQLGSPA